MSDKHKNMNIAFLTSRDPQDRRSWSGILYFMAQALQKHCGEVSYIGPMDAAKEMLIGKIMHRSSQFFLKKNFMYYHGALVAKKYAKVAAQRLAQGSFDVIVAPTGAPEVAFLETDIPIVLVEDATFTLLHDYYPIFSNLLDRSFRELTTNEDLAIKKAASLVFSSAWAARSAVEDYHADEQKVHVIPFGANLEIPPSREIAEAKKKSDHCKLLFVGVNWQRKGGDIAFETLLKLEEMGMQAELVICGCTPPKTVSHERMKVIPFLDKNDEKQAKELEKLYAASDFLLLPTRFDCTPIVFSEANAFGLPVISTQTGGIPDVISDGENGFILPYNARGTEYAELIARIYQDDQRYTELVRSSRAAFEDRLNWDAWGVAVKYVIDELLGHPCSRSGHQESVMREHSCISSVIARLFNTEQALASNDALEREFRATNQSMLSIVHPDLYLLGYKTPRPPVLNGLRRTARKIKVLRKMYHFLQK